MVPMEDSIGSLEQLFLALADKTRLRLLGLMADGEVSVGYLAERISESQPKVSRHLAYLRNAGIVSTRRDGKWVYYSISPADDPAAANVLDALLANFRTTSPEEQPVGYSMTRPIRNVETEGRFDDQTSDAELPIYLL